MNQFPRLRIVVVLPILSKIVCETNEPYSKRTTRSGGDFCCSDRIPLKINEFIKTPNSKITENFKIRKIPNFANVNSTKNAESNFTFGVIDMLDGFGSCLLYTSPSPRDATLSRMPSSA